MITDKATARIIVKEARKNIALDSLSKKSRQIAEKVLNTKEYRKNQILFAYIPCNNETDTWPVINQALCDGKTVAIPRVVGENMIFYQYKENDILEDGYMGIKEPLPNGRIIDSSEGLIIVPGVAFDTKCNRVGYGKGFYDRFLASHPHCDTIGICFDFQIFEEVETNSADKQIDMLITESKSYKGEKI